MEIFYIQGDAMLTSKTINFEKKFYTDLKRYYENISANSPSGNLYLRNQHGKKRLYLNNRYISKDALPLIGNFINGQAAKKILLILESNLIALDIIQAQFTPYSEIPFDDMQQSIESQVIPKFQSAFPDLDLDGLSRQPKQLGNFSDKASEWLEQPTLYNTFKPEEKTNKTPNGIYVRSKSELLIATMLETYNIPYKYEAQLQLGNRIVYPDFTLWDQNREKLVYWEHFGMMWNKAYSEKNMKKIYDYLNFGYRLGDNFIATYDDKTGSIDMGILHKIINAFYKIKHIKF